MFDMIKSRRFMPIAKLADSKEQQTARVLGKSQQVLNAHEVRLTELKTYRAEYVESYMTAGGQGMSIDHMRNYRFFLENLNKAITQQEVVVAESSQLMHQDRSHWLDSLSRKKVLGKVIDKYKHQEQKEGARKEQREMDDRSPVIKK